MEFLDLDDLDKYMLELHRKDRQFTDLVPEPDAANDQERIFHSRRSVAHSLYYRLCRSSLTSQKNLKLFEG